MRAPFLVGLVLLASTASLTWLMMSTSKNKFSEDKTYSVYADFFDASGLRWKTRVQINGLDVGKIEDIEHARNEQGALTARVRIRLLKDFQIYPNARVRKAAESLLGDFRLDIDPGGPYNSCNERKPCDASHECISGRCIQSCTGTHQCGAGRICEREVCVYVPYAEDAVINNVQSVSDLDEIQSQMRRVAENVAEVSESFSKVLGGPKGTGSLESILQAVESSMAAVEAATRSINNSLDRNDARIDQIVRNIQSFTGSLAHATSRKGEVSQITRNLSLLSERLNNVARSVNDMIAGGPEADGSVKNTLASLNQSVDRLNSIMGKIDKGEGTVGRVVNDPAIANKVEETLDSTNELLGGLSRLKTEIELRSEYDVPFAGNSDEVRASIKNTLALRIVPKPDKYYVLEAVSDPRGKQRRTVTTTTVDDTVTSKTEETRISFNDLKFSAQFAKRYYFLTMRFGIIENSGGLGANLHALEDDLEFRLDIFDFDRRKPGDPNGRRFPRLRTTAMYEFVNHLHLQAGVDDPFNSDLATWFFGGVLRFTDEDLKGILPFAPSP